MNKKFNLRYYISIIILIIISSALILRLGYLHILKQDFLKQQGQKRTVKKIKVAGYRGMILDRNNIPLAVSTPVNSVWINSKKIELTPNKTLALSKILKIPEQDIIKIASNNKSFSYLKRQVSPDVVKPLKNLKINGLYIDNEYKRFYPESDVVSTLVGRTDIDHNGTEGLELAFDSILKGKHGYKKIITDLTGREVEFIEELTSPKPGKDLQLSIDKQLQYLAYRTIQKAVKKHKAKSANAVILNVETGEVISMVNYPSFNPNYSQKYNSNFKNKTVTDIYEPGSVMKAIIMAGIIEAGVDLETKIDTSPGYMEMPDGNVVRDLRNLGIIDLTEILKKSSNVAISKLILELPDNYVTNFYEKMGFNFMTESLFPGEASGILTVPHVKDKFSLATLSFGYGIAVTTLQLTRAYAILGAKGIKYPISFIKGGSKLEGERVISEKTANETIKMLTEVVESGSGVRAKIPGYKIAGKTGTARVLDKNGYRKDKHISIFSGIIPADKPKFAITVFIEEPKSGLYYGSMVAAPVFKEIANHAFRVNNILPNY